jgi:hypothetical protein
VGIHKNLFICFRGGGFLLHCCPWVGGFSSFGCHLDLTTSNIVVSKQKNKPCCGHFFSFPQAGFSQKKGSKKYKFPASGTAFQLSAVYNTNRTTGYFAAQKRLVFQISARRAPSIRSRSFPGALPWLP